MVGRYNPYNNGVEQIANNLLGNKDYNDVRTVAENVEKIKHVAEYMPQLYRLSGLTQDMVKITEVVDDVNIMRLSVLAQKALVDTATALIQENTIISSQKADTAIAQAALAVSAADTSNLSANEARNYASLLGGNIFDAGTLDEVPDNSSDFDAGEL